MGSYYIEPEYFQMIHYYFFCLGMFSLTASFLFTAYNAYTYLLMAFYAVNSAIAWYMSWFMHSKMKAVFIVRTGRYAASHVLLTVLSGGAAVALYFLFQIEFEAFMTAFIMVNFFVIFLGLIWYVLSILKIADRFFEWQEEGKLETGRDMVLRYRARGGLKLLDERTLKDYKWGTNTAIDHLFMQAKMHAGRGEDFSDVVRDIELKLSEMSLRELEGKVENLKKAPGGKGDENLLQGYMGAIRSRERSMLEYEKEGQKRKDAEKKAQ